MEKIVTVIEKLDVSICPRQANLLESLNASIEKSAPDAFLAALGEAAREHGMAKVAKISGLSRESLYRTLKTGSKLRFDTVQRVLNALGYRFVIQKST